MRRIIYLCPADDTPTGGIKVIYRHAERLAEFGVKSFVLHPFKPDFSCTWFDHSVRFLRTSALNPEDDFVVIPELWASTFGPQCMAQKVRFGIFVQNGYLTRPVLPEHSPELCHDIYRAADLVLAISEDSARMVRLNYPGVAPAQMMRVRYSVNERFSSASEEASAPFITFMPRKMASHAALVVFALSQNLPPGWQIIPIHNMDEATVARMLARSRIFLAFSEFEGLPLPPLEAALSGNIVIGYTGQGAREYWDRPNFVEIQQGDIQGFVAAVREAVSDIAGSRLTRADLDPGIARLARTFAVAAESANLRKLVAGIEACFQTAPIRRAEVGEFA